MKTTGFKEEYEKIKSLGKVFDEEMIDELNDLGLEWRDDARVNIHRVSGDLARSTNLVKADKIGRDFSVGIANNLEYAEHYEYGHRQTPGRYVPGLGRVLKASYVKGQHTFREARQKAKAQLPKRIRVAIKRAEDRLND